MYLYSFCLFDKGLLAVDHLIAFGRNFRIGAGREQTASFQTVVKLRFKILEQLLFQLRIFDGNTDFYAALGVAGQ